MKVTVTTRLLNCRCVILAALMASGIFPTTAASLQLVSIRNPSFAPPASGGGDSGLPIITGDGRYVCVFTGGPIPDRLGAQFSADGRFLAYATSAADSPSDP